MQSSINMNMKGGRMKNFAALLAAVWLLLFTGCDRGPNDTGWDYFPDMVYSPAYRTWSENPLLEDGKTMQAPVEGTIPRNMIPFQYEKTEEDLERAGRELINPLQPSAAILERGQEVFTVYCMNCHGEKGDGLGHLYTSGKYLVPPASLITEKVVNYPDGSIYHVISRGWGVMAEHATLIRPEDRWKVIHYIRQELQSQAK
jgi:mono/diheme cytochrome c family protein